MKYLAGDINPETGLPYPIMESGADLTGDGTVDEKDLIRLVRNLGGAQ